jgi:hypothetical protein
MRHASTPQCPVARLRASTQYQFFLSLAFTFPLSSQQSQVLVFSLGSFLPVAGQDRTSAVLLHLSKQVHTPLNCLGQLSRFEGRGSTFSRGAVM